MPIASSLLKKPRLVKKLKDFYDYVQYNDGKVGTKTRGIDYSYHLVDGCHIWQHNVNTSRMAGMSIGNHYGWGWDDKTKLSLYKYTNY